MTKGNFNPRSGSWNDWLSTFELGERRYIEMQDTENFSAFMRTVVTPRTRRPESMKGMEFTAGMFTAVGLQKIGIIRYLMCVERIS